MFNSTKWDEYTDAEILSLPYDLPALSEKYADRFGKRIRTDLYPIKVTLLCDMLTFHSIHSMPFQSRDPKGGRKLV
jgi:hypothetical protein